MAKKRSKRPQDERSPEVISWRVPARIAGLLEGAAMIRACPLSKILEEGATQHAMEIVSDAIRGLGHLRRKNRRDKARKAGLARQAKRRA